MCALCLFSSLLISLSLFSISTLCLKVVFVQLFTNMSLQSVPACQARRIARERCTLFTHCSVWEEEEHEPMVMIYRLTRVLARAYNRSIKQVCRMYRESKASVCDLECKAISQKLESVCVWVFAKDALVNFGYQNNQ